MVSNIRIKQLRSLHQKKGRLAAGLFLAEGSRIVADLLATGFPMVEIFALPAWLEENEFLFEGLSVPVHLLKEKELNQLSELSTPQEVIACCKIPESKLPVIESGKLVLVLDSIRDPGNMGTLIRLADWFGLAGVVASSDSVEWTNPKVIQSTMGSFARIQPHYTELASWLESLDQLVPVFAAELAGEDLYASDFEPYGLLIVSNEAHGLSDNLAPFIRKKLRIPRFIGQDTGAESLNVAMAAAIFLGEFSRKQRLHV
jgi:TrmH family RNA methyltransferase